MFYADAHSLIDRQSRFGIPLIDQGNLISRKLLCVNKTNEENEYKRKVFHVDKMLNKDK